jgi:hypothetical protein
MKPDQVQAVIDAFNSDQFGNRIAAIKKLRNNTNLGLKEAKEAIDKHITPLGLGVYCLNVASFKAEWLDSPTDRATVLVERMRTLRDEMERVLAEFAELADGFHPETQLEPPKPIGVGSKVKVLESADWPEYEGQVGTVRSHDLRDEALPWHVEFDDGEYVWFGTDDLEVVS